jgi:hypothetical protein
MDNHNLTPKESLTLISKVITEARYQFQENGIIYMMWGILMGIAGTGQYILIYLELYEINYYPYFLMPIGGVISYIYYRKKFSSQSNTITRLINWVWIIVGINIIVLGFCFPLILQVNLVPVILLILSLGAISSAIFLNERVLHIAGICINLLGFATFFIEYEYHSIVTAATGFLFIFVPGFILNRKNAINEF